MSATLSSVVDAPLDEVFTWHGRPGALLRLTPPWLPLRVAQEAVSLRDGRAVLVFPGGVRWVARHSGYDPPHQFVDELVSLPLHWRHVHRFDAESATATRVTDSIDTPIPEALLRQTLLYRHRQLRDDLDAHRRFATVPLTVAVTGSSGLVGGALTALLTSGGHRVIRLVRGTPGSEDERQWRPDDPSPDLFDDVDVVVHLAGASIAGRFTEGHKATVRDSRVPPTRRAAEVIAASSRGPRALVCASAIGFYGADRGDEELTEHSEQGEGFLAELVSAWEAAADPARGAGIRVVNVRTGIVQSPRGGTLGLLRPLFAAGLGGRIGDGRQWMSWIDVDDLTDVYYRAITQDDLSGPVNAVSPDPVRNGEYASTLGAVMRRPAVLPTPPLGPRALLGSEGARELAMASQNVLPLRLLDAGHAYRHPTLDDCLRHQLGRVRSA